MPRGRSPEQEAAPTIPHSSPFWSSSLLGIHSPVPPTPHLRFEASPDPGPPGDVEAGGSSDQAGGRMGAGQDGGRTVSGETKPAQQSQAGFQPGSPPVPSQGVGRQQGPLLPQAQFQLTGAKVLFAHCQD